MDTICRPDAKGYDQHLHGKCQCQCVYRILAHICDTAGIRDPRHKHAVHNVVAGLQYH